MFGKTIIMIVNWMPVVAARLSVMWFDLPGWTHVVIKSNECIMKLDTRIQFLLKTLCKNGKSTWTDREKRLRENNGGWMEREIDMQCRDDDINAYCYSMS